jgi:hypothetical protein
VKALPPFEVVRQKSRAEKRCDAVLWAANGALAVVIVLWLLGVVR